LYLTEKKQIKIFVFFRVLQKLGLEFSNVYRGKTGQEIRSYRLALPIPQKSCQNVPIFVPDKPLFFKKSLKFPNFLDTKKASENSLLTVITGFIKTVIFGLKIPRGRPRLGSIPSSGTRKIRGLANVILLSPFLVVLSERHPGGQSPRTHRSKNRQRDIKWDVEAAKSR